MKMKFVLFLFLLFGLTLSSSGVHAQVNKNIILDTSVTYLIKLTDKSELVGHYVERTSDYLVFRTPAVSRLQIAFDQIVSIQELSASNIKGNVYWSPNPRPTNYFFWPSAINLKKGEGYFQNNMLFLNSVHYGVTDNISIGGGLEFISLFSGTPVLFFTPKVTFPAGKNFHAGAGVLLVTIPDEGSGGFLYGSATAGSIEHNVSGSLGFGFAGGEFASTPLINISGMTRVSRKLMLMSENWILPLSDETFTAFSAGVRILGDKIAADVGLVYSPDAGVPFPIAGFSVKF
ncbi:hypothetical protein HRH25_10120 [Flavisolibacter sp. BT320]|nr:hypothetical protein [Flavisolibacter longurius]